MPPLLKSIPGPAVVGDAFAVVGSGFPADAALVFGTGAGAVTIPATLARPQLVVVARLPELPAGDATLKVVSASGVESGGVSVKVGEADAPALRVLNPGAAKAAPFTIAFVANPVYVQHDADGNSSFLIDPILSSRSKYLDCLGFCLQCLFDFEEDLLRAGGVDAQIRLVSIFDPAKAQNVANALAEEYVLSDTFGMKPWDGLDGVAPPGTRGLSGFKANYGVDADVVFAIHDNAGHPRAAATPIDDGPAGGTAFSFDTAHFAHRPISRNPGGLAIFADEPRDGVTPAHEFGHAVSTYADGFVTDLYDDADGLTGHFDLNLKSRPSLSAQLPERFARFNEADFAAEPPDGGTGEDRSGWLTYHSRRRDSTVPAIMDNYWKARPHARKCLHDEITRRYLGDRLAVKLAR